MRVWPSSTRWAIAIRPTSTLSTLTEAKRAVRWPIVTTPSPQPLEGVDLVVVERHLDEDHPVDTAVEAERR